MAMVWGESIEKLILHVTTVLTATNIGVVLANNNGNHWNLDDLYEMVQIGTWHHDLLLSASIQFFEEEMSSLQHELEEKITDLTCYFAYQFEVASFGGQILLHYCHWHWRLRGYSVQPMMHEPNVFLARSLNKKRIEALAKYLFKWKDPDSCYATENITTNNIGSIMVFGGNSGHCYLTSSFEEAEIFVSLLRGVSHINERGARSNDCITQSFAHFIMLLPAIELGRGLQTNLSWQSYVWGTTNIVSTGNSGSIVFYDQVAYKMCKMCSFCDFLTLARLTASPLIKNEYFSIPLDISPCLHVAVHSEVHNFGGRLQDDKTVRTWETIEQVMVHCYMDIKEYSDHMTIFLVHFILERSSLGEIRFKGVANQYIKSWVFLWKLLSNQGSEELLIVPSLWMHKQTSALHTQHKNCSFYAPEISPSALHLWQLDSASRTLSKSVDSGLILLLLEKHPVHFLNKQLGTTATAKNLLHHVPFDPGGSFSFCINTLEDKHPGISLQSNYNFYNFYSRSITTSMNRGYHSLLSTSGSSILKAQTIPIWIQDFFL